MDKFAVAGYDRDKQNLSVKVLDLNGVVDLLKRYKHYGYEPEQLEKLKKDLVNPKGYYVDFQTAQFRILKISSDATMENSSPRLALKQIEMLAKKPVGKGATPDTIPPNPSEEVDTDNPVFSCPFNLLRVHCKVEWISQDGKETPSPYYTEIISYDTLVDIGALYCIDENRREILQDILSRYISKELTDATGFSHRGVEILSISPVA